MTGYLLSSSCCCEPDDPPPPNECGDAAGSCADLFDGQSADLELTVELQVVGTATAFGCELPFEIDCSLELVLPWVEAGPGAEACSWVLPVAPEPTFPSCNMPNPLQDASLWTFGAGSDAAVVRRAGSNWEFLLGLRFDFEVECPSGSTPDRFAILQLGQDAVPFDQDEPDCPYGPNGTQGPYAFSGPQEFAWDDSVWGPDTIEDWSFSVSVRLAP